MKLPVYSRADLSRTVALVVALSLTAVSTSAAAREFRAADTQNVIKALGAEPIELPYGQVLTGLATKLIDGAENNWPSFVTTGHYKYAGYYTLTEHTMGPEVLIMSQKAWEGLSNEDRKIFRDAATQSSQFMRAKWSAL